MTEPHDFAFPVSNRRDVPTETSVGLTKRELFAAILTASLNANPNWTGTKPEVICLKGVKQADALIAELNKDQK